MHCAQVVICCEPVPIVQCREDSIPFICALLVAILPSLNTCPPKWRATSLTLMMLDTQPCTGQPKRVSCPWWSTLWDPVDLMWRQLTRLAYIVCCLSDAFCGQTLWTHQLHGHSRHAPFLCLSCVNLFVLFIVCNVVFACTPVVVVHY